MPHPVYYDSDRSGFSQSSIYQDGEKERGVWGKGDLKSSGLEEFLSTSAQQRQAKLRSATVL